MRARGEAPIALVGIMGSGKSTVARLLAERGGLDVIDLDEAIEAQAGCSIAELFAREGEPAFRRRESEALRAALGAGAGVVACGGGIVLDPSHRSMLRDHCHAVWLEVSAGEAWKRLESASRLRPLLGGGGSEQRLGVLLAERAPLYGEVARTRIATDGHTAEEVAAAVVDALEERDG